MSKPESPTARPPFRYRVRYWLWMLKLWWMSGKLIRSTRRWQDALEREEASKVVPDRRRRPGPLTANEIAVRAKVKELTEAHKAKSGANNVE